jgi:hypothetical protein
MPGLLTESADLGNAQRVIGEVRGVDLMQGNELVEGETRSDRTANLKATHDLPEAGVTGGRIVPHPDSRNVGLRHSLAAPGGGGRRREFR